eukprot:scaffold3334_cov369-Prasinococcus_capsulatus_cf.AAC.16
MGLESPRASLTGGRIGGGARAGCGARFAVRWWRGCRAGAVVTRVSARPGPRASRRPGRSGPRRAAPAPIAAHLERGSARPHAPAPPACLLAVGRARARARARALANPPPPPIRYLGSRAHPSARWRAASSARRGRGREPARAMRRVARSRFRRDWEWQPVSVFPLRHCRVHMSPTCACKRHVVPDSLSDGAGRGLRCTGGASTGNTGAAKRM